MHAYYGRSVWNLGDKDVAYFADLRGDLVSIDGPGPYNAQKALANHDNDARLPIVSGETVVSELADYAARTVTEAVSLFGAKTTDAKRFTTHDMPTRERMQLVAELLMSNAPIASICVKATPGGSMIPVGDMFIDRENNGTWLALQSASACGDAKLLVIRHGASDDIMPPNGHILWAVYPAPGVSACCTFERLESHKPSMASGAVEINDVAEHASKVASAVGDVVRVPPHWHVKLSVKASSGGFIVGGDVIEFMGIRDRHTVELMDVARELDGFITLNLALSFMPTMGMTVRLLNPRAGVSDTANIVGIV